MNRVWVTGDAVVDLIPNDELSYLKCPGGAPANVAVAISRLSGDTAFFGRVGDDPLGHFMQQILINEGVNVAHLHCDAEQRTSTVVVSIDAQGERSFTFMVKPSADQFFAECDIPAFTANQWLHCCSIALANEPSRSATFEAMQRMKKAGGYVSFDPNLREEVWSTPSELKPSVLKAIDLADVLKFSEEELCFLTDTSSLEEGLSYFANKPEKLVIITLGAKGALVLFNGEQKRIAGQKVQNVVDTTGAGDAFVGGLLSKLAQQNKWYNWDIIEAAVAWGNGCGALAISKKGAMTALPTRSMLEEFIS